jgi:ATP adenylyltransferase
MQLSEAAAFTIFGGVAVILSLNARKSSGGAIGSIRERTRAVTAAAAASGAIKKLTTTGRVMVDGPTGLQFFVSKKSAAAEAGRQASGAVAKQNKPAQRVDPFASPEEALVVERALTTSHYLQLNKFPIVDDHLLIVTRDFEYQTDVATRADFDALRATLRAVDGFVFYNCGARSGASQPHKHFQMLPRDTLKQLEAEAVGGAQMSHEIPIE